MTAPEWQLARAMEGYVTTQLLYVAAKLGVADALAGGPRTGAEVAQAVGAEPTAVTRVLRGLAVEQIVDELDGGRCGLTPVGAALRKAQGAVVARGEIYYRAASGLLDAVREGGTAFERVHGERFFEHSRAAPGAGSRSLCVDGRAAEREAADVSRPMTSAASAGSWTLAADAVSCCPRSCAPRPTCGVCCWTATR